MASEAELRSAIWELVSGASKSEVELHSLADRVGLDRGEAAQIVERMIADGQLRREVDTLVAGARPPEE